MIVYVETNFLLEIILGQEELKFAQEIVLLKKELSQLKRSVYHTQVVQLIQDLSPKIMRIEYAELERLEATFLSLLQTGSPIDLTY